jgi:hypothetical protein
MWIKISERENRTRSGFFSISETACSDYGREFTIGESVDSKLGFHSCNVYYRESVGDFEGDDLLPVGEWMHVAIRYDGTTMALFHNGQKVGSRSKPTHTVSDCFQIGKRCATEETFFGYMDEVRLWNIALSDDQIASDKDAVAPLSEGLIGHWDMRTNSNTLLDATENNDGSLEGSASIVQVCETITCGDGETCDAQSGRCSSENNSTNTTDTTDTDTDTSDTGSGTSSDGGISDGDGTTEENTYSDYSSESDSDSNDVIQKDEPNDKESGKYRLSKTGGIVVGVVTSSIVTILCALIVAIRIRKYRKDKKTRKNDH